MLLLAASLLFLTGGGLAFGPLKMKMDKLRPGQTLEDAIKKIRRMGYLVMGLSIFLILFIIFVIMPMGAALLHPS